ncbi:MAG: Rrf2 family transcriptional regulator [Oscillospiraceae bacterium]|nr:Rrf2 family transcriptional regulator [Oscillospiraceae bacterium]
MRILTKIQCGLVIIADIAINSENGGAVNLYEIAERRAISVKYLEQIVTRLRQSSLVKSIKGPHGGYILSRSPDKITVKEILDAIDITLIGNDIAPLEECNSDIADILNNMLWSRIERSLSEFTSSLTLLDIVNEFKKTVQPSEQMMYYI